MATVTGYTAARMKAIEDNAIINGAVVGDNLMLTRYNTVQINAGNVRGPQGIQGPIGGAGGILGPPGRAVNNQPNITTEVDLINLSTVASVTANRHVKVSFQVGIARDIPNGSCIVKIKEGLTVLARFNIAPTTAESVDSLSGFVLLTPTSGAHTYKLSMSRDGTGNVTMASDATMPALILAEDIGAV